MPVEVEEAEVQDATNEGASTSAVSAAAQKQDKKKNLPWIEKYRPQKFEEIMGESKEDFALIVFTFLNSNYRQ